MKSNAYENDLVRSQIVGNLAVIKQIQDLDYEGMINFLEEA